MTTPTATPEVKPSGRDESAPSNIGLGEPVTSEEVTAKLDFTAKLKAVQLEQQKIVRLPDGSARVNIVIDPEMIEILEEWALGAGESFEEYLPKIVSMGLQAVVNGGSVAG